MGLLRFRSKTDNFKVVKPGVGYITVCKFEDLSNDGVRDPGEPPIPGWPINATGVDSGPITTQTQDPDGCVSFSVSSFSGEPLSANVSFTEGTLGADWVQTMPAGGAGYNITVGKKPATSLPFRPEPAYLGAFAAIMARIGKALGETPPAKPVLVCVAGGAALHFYTGGRVSQDIDAKIMARVLLDPRDLQVAYRGEDGRARILYFDTQYSDRFALLHENAYDDAVRIAVPGIDSRRLEIRLLTPLDLAVSKLARFSEQDREDIRALAREGLIDAADLRRRALAALSDYIGNLDRVRGSIDIACRLVASETKER